MKKREEYQASRPQFNSGTELWLFNDDVAICHSLYSGQEGDPYLEYYIAHEKPAATQGQRSTVVYCPVESGHDGNYDCSGCKEGLKLKDRFAMWFYVYRILCKNVKQGETLPTMEWVDGNTYFVREVNGPRLWDTSAWKESPLSTIYMLAKQLGDLRKTRVTLRRVVTDPRAKVPELSVRYQFLPEMGSPAIDAALYADVTKEIKPVTEMLLDKISSVPVVQSPESLPQATPPTILPFKAPDAVASPAGDAAPTLPPFTPPEKPEKLF